MQMVEMIFLRLAILNIVLKRFYGFSVKRKKPLRQIRRARSVIQANIAPH
jgi:hypothetical protein